MQRQPKAPKTRRPAPRFSSNSNAGGNGKAKEEQAPSGSAEIQVAAQIRLALAAHRLLWATARLIGGVRCRSPTKPIDRSLVDSRSSCLSP
jgi:hypothetical protein